jgi:peptidoglycan/LPS O-acetylase OafA/YrhL
MFWASALRLWREGYPLTRPHRFFVLAVGGLAAGIFTAVGVGMLAVDIGGATARLLLGTGLGVALFLAFLWVVGAPRPVLALGRWSYSIYLFHPVPLYALHAGATAGVFGPLPSGTVALAIFVVAGLTIAIAAAVYRLVEAPAMAWGHLRAKAIEGR